VELIGTQSPLADAEVIMLNLDIFEGLGMQDLTLLINTVGCGKCKPNYEDALRASFKDDLEGLCQSCQTRYDKNILRILDCKNPSCRPIIEKAPAIYETVCEECKDHFDDLRNTLDNAGVSYTVDPRLVRGLDYYTKTAFEIQDASLGAQNAVCGGGRYDELIGMFNNGKDIPAVGSALGIERLLLSLGEGLRPAATLEVFVIAFADTKEHLYPALTTLRKEGVTASTDYNIPSVKSQFKTANKLGAQHVLLLGPDETAQGKATLRDMRTGEEDVVSIEAACAAIRDKRTMPSPSADMPK
jgi:histidyl-tRNA synthetase